MRTAVRAVIMEAHPFLRLAKLLSEYRDELLDEATFIKRPEWSPSWLAKALAAHRVFFMDDEGNRVDPAIYGDAAYDRRPLYSVTRTLGDLPGGAKMWFFTSPRVSLSRRTPLEALLAGELAPVRAAAEAYVGG